MHPAPSTQRPNGPPPRGAHDLCQDCSAKANQRTNDRQDRTLQQEALVQRFTTFKWRKFQGPIPSIGRTVYLPT